MTPRARCHHRLVGAAALLCTHLAAGQAVPALEPGEIDPETTPLTEACPLGYDLVLVMDTTTGMQPWLLEAADALASFVDSVQRGCSASRTPFRMGLLFYRDRKFGTDCDLEYLFRWEAELTTDVAAVTRALARAQEADCHSDEPAESVYDALNRAILDPDWEDGHLKVVLLVGDAPPHPPSDKVKNPLGLDGDAIRKMAEVRNVRLMSFGIGAAAGAEFKALALATREEVKGRFRAIDTDDRGALRAAVLSLLGDEWELLTKSNQAVAAGKAAEPR
jgi:hypothetical protein